MSRTRKRRGRRRPNPITLRHKLGCTVLTDARFGRVIVPGTWQNVAEVRLAIERLPLDMIRGKFHN